MAIEAGAEVRPAGQTRALVWLATATLLAMSTWFSASAVIPQLRELWALSDTAAAMLTIAVQLGFVVGALTSAVLTLADVITPRRLILLAALGAAAANLSLLATEGGSAATVARFATGVFLAGVYPPGVKAMSSWYQVRRGTALGVLIGALTLGSALPHLVNALGGLDWRTVIVTTSVLTVLGGTLAVVAVDDGPFPFPRAPFEPRAALAVLRDRQVRLASFGYFGHMWELYAMWAWIVAFLAASFEARDVADAELWAAAGAFAAIAIGAAGCVVGGILADRRSRTWLTSLAMLSSGIAAALIGLTFGGPVVLVVVVALFWGFWVVADSAQFSAIVTEVADQRYVGTAVTLQLALGFTLTVATIWIVPQLVDLVGWRWSFLVLTPGPLLGTVAMVRLGRLRPPVPATP